MSASSPSSALAAARWRIVLSAVVFFSASVRMAARWPGSGGGGMATGKRGVWSTAKAGVQPNSGNIAPQPTMRYCWTIEKIVGDDPVDEQAGGQEAAVRIEMSGRNSIVWRWMRAFGSSLSGSAAGSIIRDWTSWSAAETMARTLSPNPHDPTGTSAGWRCRRGSARPSRCTGRAPRRACRWPG